MMEIMIQTWIERVSDLMKRRLLPLKIKGLHGLEV